MNNSQRKTALRIAQKLLPADEYQRLVAIEVKDHGFGFDQFGLERESAILALAFIRYLYKYYFRVESDGVEHIPLNSRSILASNHSGVIPIDGMMIAADLVFRPARPRIIRAMVDNFMGFLPFLNVFFCRVGQVVGARRNFSDLLEAEELVCVFPEGAKALGKPYTQRYNLFRFHLGFIELSLKHKAPIIPTAVVGAEEQAPLIYNIKSIARLLRLPYFPITPTFPMLGPLGLIPLPTKYHIYYGEPLHFYKDYPPETIQEPEKVRMLADQVQMIVQEMLNDGLDRRTSVMGFGEG